MCYGIFRIESDLVALRTGMTLQAAQAFLIQSDKNCHLAGRRSDLDPGCTRLEVSASDSAPAFVLAICIDSAAL